MSVPARVQAAVVPPIEWHIITCEYPPQIGGVSSYVASVAEALGAAGHSVHVWCPPAPGSRHAPAGVVVHGELGRFSPADLRRAGRLLDGFAGPRRLLLQWVPHGYGYRSMNLPLCLWIRRRASRGDLVDIMVHEAFLAFEGNWKQKAAAAVHRVMTFILLSAARRIWISTPAWRRPLEPFARKRPLEWLPIPSPVDPIDDPVAVASIRSRHASAGNHVVGHFGMYSRLTAGTLKEVIPQVLARLEGVVVLLMGQGSQRLRDEILCADSRLAPRLPATGELTFRDLSLHLQACDLMVQPYPEGVTTRRTSTMAPLAHGTPLVTTLGPSTESVWRERRGVSLVPFEAGAIVDEVVGLLADAPGRAQLGERGRELYRDTFHVRHTVDALAVS
jgi:glycosyltransferase involved in cell wall biosynthesis